MYKLGYIGLLPSITFANHGSMVLRVDIKKGVELLNNGVIHIEYPGLQYALENAIKQKRIKVSLNPEKADAFIIAVRTSIIMTNTSHVI
ncbi:hypothetical protein [Peribacillus frigoritolerans]|uniref:hypothetical protein n=1 Tax=Peribacillus frigoritolerans TaxID=450367 RepID=UPI003B8AF4C5